MGVSLMGRGSLGMSCLWALVLLSGLALSNALSSTSATTTGINYGQVADDLPSPELVVGLLQTSNIGRIKLYTVNATVLKAFANTGIELIVGVPNEIIGNLTDPNSATEWVNENIQAYLPATKITGIAVGNEVYTTDTQLMANLVPAMQNIHSALVSIGADTDIIISTPHSFGVLVTSYPPSAGSFQPGLESLMEQLLALLSQIGSPFFINAYPYFTYKDQPSQIPLDYVLLEPNASAVVDQNNNVVYKNMLYAQVDAVYSALSALGYPNLEVIVTETGWPSNGDADEAGATLQNAQTYNGNLLQLLAQNKGTPLRPNVVLQAYLFALFNEDMKPGPTSERNYGLFEPNGIEVYDVGLTGSLSLGNKKAVSVGSPTGSADTPYYTISFAKETCTDISFYNHLQVLALSSFLVLLLFLP